MPDVAVLERATGVRRRHGLHMLMSAWRDRQFFTHVASSK
jgi:hypothetical protein